MSTYKTGNQTRLDIINAAKKLFYEKGYVDTTASEICKLANVNRGSLFYHFNNSRSDVKSFLGYRVYNDAMSICYNEAEQVCNIEDDLKQDFGLLLYWHKFFNDDNYARFMTEAAKLDTFQLSAKEYDFTFRMSTNHENDIDYDLKVTLAMGAERNLTVYLYNHRKDYTPIFAYSMTQKIYTDFCIKTTHRDNIESISDLYNSDEFSSLQIKYDFL